MSTTTDPILTAIATTAMAVARATRAMLFRLDGQALRVDAVGGAVPFEVCGQHISANAGVTGYVAASGQAAALHADQADPRLGEGAASLLGQNPTSILAVPIQGDGEVIGVLALVDAVDGRFDVNDTDRASQVAAVAAAAMTDTRLSSAVSAPDPGELSADLRRLASADPSRYANVATIIEALVR